MPSAPLDRLIRKLESITSLTPSERQAIQDLPISVRDFRADHDVAREGDRPSHSCLIIEGFMHRYKMLPDGGRQIMSFHVPGDTPDLQSLHLKTMDHSLATLTDCKAGLISHEALRDITHAHPRIADMLWRDTLIDGAIFREWIVNVGSREAYNRIAHLLCEVFLKLDAVGLTNGTTFEFPVTQAEIGDATGLSTVHVNRSIQKLRSENLLVLERNRCTINDWEGLKRAGMFDPAYLHINSQASAA